MPGWLEVSDGVLQRRYDPLDVSVTAVRGEDGLLLVDTRSCPREADEIRHDLRELGDLALRWVVNTHAHYDHTFGNQQFGPGSNLDLPIYGHRLLPAHLEAFERPRLRAWIGAMQEPAEDWLAVTITPPTHLVDASMTLDLGRRSIELIHLGRGHTDNDLMVHIPDARTWLVGDVIEESGPPMYGSGCFPLEWPGTAAALAARLSPADVVVPGHGRAVSRDFVVHQCGDLARVADLVRQLHAAGVAVDDALGEAGGKWPFPAGGLRKAVVEGYRQLTGNG